MLNILSFDLEIFSFKFKFFCVLLEFNLSCLSMSNRLLFAFYSSNFLFQQFDKDNIINCMIIAWKASYRQILLIDLQKLIDQKSMMKADFEPLIVYDQIGPTLKH